MIMDERTNMTAKEFWIRFAVWATLAVILPFVYIACAYGLFENKGTTLSGWGVVAVAFVTVMIVATVNQAKAGMPKGSMARQCIDGYMMLIPLIAAAVVVHAVRNSLAEFERFLFVMIACEAVTVPINPMPRWGAEHNLEQTENLFLSLLRRGNGKDNAAK